MVVKKSLISLLLFVLLVSPLKAMEEEGALTKRVIPHLNWEELKSSTHRPHKISLFETLVYRIYVCLEKESASPTVTVACPPPQESLGSDFINTLALALNAQAFYLAISDHLNEMTREAKTDDLDAAPTAERMVGLSTLRRRSYMDHQLLWEEQRARAEERDYRWRCRVQKRLKGEGKELPFEKVRLQYYSTPSFLENAAQSMLKIIEQCNERLYLPNPSMPTTLPEAKLILQELRLAFVKAHLVSQNISPVVNSTSDVILRKRQQAFETFSKLFTPDFESQLIQAAQERLKVTVNPSKS